MGERRQYEPGAFCWAGLASSDPAGALDFYARLFGWDAEAPRSETAGPYSVLIRRGAEVAILYRQTAEARAVRAAPHWTVSVSVADADEAVSRATGLGGSAAFRRPFDVPGAGRVAAIRDPAGAVLSLWQPAGSPGAAVVEEPGAVCANLLVTPQPKRSMAFYGPLFGWRYRDGRHGKLLIESADRPTGAIIDASKCDIDGLPAWLPCFGVESIAETTRSAERLGGRLVLTPPHSYQSGVLAVLADPQGAPFAVTGAAGGGFRGDG